MYNRYNGVNKYVIWVVVVLSVLMWYRVQKFNNATMDAVREAEGRGPKGKVEAGLIAETFDGEMVKVKALLASYDYAEASRLFREANGDVERCFMYENLTAMPDGERLSTWHQARLKELNEGPLVESAKILVERLKAGEGTFDDVTVFRHGFSGSYSYLRDKVFRESMPDIESARAAMAHNWIRVDVVSNYHLYDQVAKKVVKDRADSCTPYRIVYGRALGYAEEAATAKTIKIRITETGVLYGFEGREEQHGSGTIPEKLVIDFAVKNSKDKSALVSSWDQLPQIVIEEKLPESYAFKFKNKRQGADFDSIIKKQKDVLSAKLSESLKNLPALNVQ